MQNDPSFVAHRPILTDEAKAWLHTQACRYPLARFKGDARCYDEMAVDFVYTSAKIEGNTYNRIDTDNLLRLGVTAGGKRYLDAVMLVNSAVQIGASKYTPPADAGRLRVEMGVVLAEAQKYSDAFEAAIHLHCNVAYLQCFRDGNKRTARLMQTAALVRGDQLPLFFSDDLIDQYQRATVHYYETGEYGPYVSFFIQNYELAVNRLLGVHGEDATPSRRYGF